MSSTGPNNNGYLFNVEEKDWELSSGDFQASVSLPAGSNSKFLKSTGFGFSIPTDATIDGIVVEWGCETLSGRTPPPVNDHAVRLVKNSRITNTDRSKNESWAQGMNDIRVYGSSTDLWGEAWTPEEINSAEFGAALKVVGGNIASEAFVNSVQITIYFTEA